MVPFHTPRIRVTVSANEWENGYLMKQLTTEHGYERFAILRQPFKNGGVDGTIPSSA